MVPYRRFAETEPRMTYYMQIIGCINPFSTWNRFMNRKKKALEQRDMVTTKAELTKNISICDSKIESLEKQIASIYGNIPELLRNKKKLRAQNEFRRAKGLQASIAILEKQRFSMQTQDDSMGMVYTQQSLLAGWKEFAKSSGSMLSEKTIKEMDTMMEKLGEANDGVHDFSTNMDMLTSAASAVSVDDEMALMKEFEETYMAQEDVGDLPKIPSSRILRMPPSVTEPIIREKEEEEEDRDEIVAVSL